MNIHMKFKQHSENQFLYNQLEEPKHHPLKPFESFKIKSLNLKMFFKYHCIHTQLYCLIHV